MGQVSSLTITDSGNGLYTTAPTIKISAPADASLWNLDSDHSHDYAKTALRMDSADVVEIGTVTDSVGGDNTTFHMLQFWFWLDSVEPQTLAWSNNFRVYVDRNSKLAVTFAVDSSQKDTFQTDNVVVRNSSSYFVSKNQWHHARIETLGHSGGLRIGLDNNHMGTYALSFDEGDNYLYDSGDVIRIGYDSGYTGPNHKENFGGQYRYDSDINKGFAGYLNYFELTIDSTRSPVSFDNNDQAEPDSAGATYRGITPMIQETFDYGTATATCTIDSNGFVNTLSITDSGSGYDSAPTVQFIGGTAVDSDYQIGDSASQTLTGGVKISGEIMRVIKESDGEFVRYIMMGHVGADDGKYHTFTTGTQLINSSRGSRNNGYEIISVTDSDNKLMATEQNTLFSTTSDDFLDFSENNPFGDPEDQ